MGKSEQELSMYRGPGFTKSPRVVVDDAFSRFKVTLFSCWSIVTTVSIPRGGGGV